MDTTQSVLFIALATAILSVVLGFAALLSQKIYIDPKTEKPTEIKIPIVGKMKTNYPSLVFVMLGFALIFFIVQQLLSGQPDRWLISGQFFIDETRLDMGWSDTNINVHPCDMDATINHDTGVFTISVGIKKGVSFEDRIEVIGYSDSYGSAAIIPKEEFRKRKNNQDNLIKILTDKTREYKPVKLVKMPGGE
ncbi:MAG TPA: hypothetical protein EYG88_12845 [Desulfocapsa sulfexigens]|nr:hypothetical protein [Desulfocapsa sulfexigens]